MKFKDKLIRTIVILIFLAFMSYPIWGGLLIVKFIK